MPENFNNFLFSIIVTNTKKTRENNNKRQRRKGLKIVAMPKKTKEIIKKLKNKLTTYRFLFFWGCVFTELLKQYKGKTKRKFFLKFCDYKCMSCLSNCKPPPGMNVWVNGGTKCVAYPKERKVKMLLMCDTGDFSKSNRFFNKFKPQLNAFFKLYCFFFF